jgi:uncharacterized membrane protein
MDVSAPDLDQIRRAVIRGAVIANPIAGTPAAALETAALIDSFGPSLMPRTSLHAGVVGGVNVLAARATATIVEAALQGARPAELGLTGQLALRATAGAAGTAATLLPQRDDERLWRPGIRSAGRLLQAASIGGAIHDLSMAGLRRFPIRTPARPVLATALSLGGLGYWASQRLSGREEIIDHWGVEQHITLTGATGTSVVVVAIGSGLTRLYLLSRGALVAWAGPGLIRELLARAANASAWAAGMSSLYNAGVAYVGRANETIEPAYARPPTTPLVSGSPESLLPYEDLGQEGRHAVTEVLTPPVIEDVLGEPAEQPIRTYVGYNSEPLYQTGRAELALAELERTGAFDRSYLLLINPTGTGWIDGTMIEAAELLTRGDIASCCIQYGRFPSFLSVQKVALGRAQFRLLLWGIRQRLMERPPERRPKVLVFGESLGAWASSDVVMYQGIQGFDHYGVDRALWVGLPGFAKWSRNGMARGSNELVPEGTVAVFDRHEQLAALTDQQRDRLRAVILSHDNDPIAALNLDLVIKRPHWLGATRGRGVPAEMRWIPIVTFWQTVLDAANAVVATPGQFRSFGHDYRADMARFVRDAFHLPSATPEQMARIEATLRTLELERADRLVADAEATAPTAPTHRDEPRASLAGVPLQRRRARGARWSFRRRLD